MPTVVTERPKLAGGSDGRRVTYFVRDDSQAQLTPANAVAEVLSIAPNDVDGYPYRNYTYEEIAVDKYDVELNYSFQSTGKDTTPEVPEGSAQYSFETNLESVKINKSLGRIASHFDATLQPGFSQEKVNGLFPGAINVDSEGKVNGTTIQVPVTRFKYSYRVPGANVTLAYQILIEDLSGAVNDATYKGRAAGSVRFDGARGVVSLDGTWNLDFLFTRRPNITGVTIGGITGVNADGWDHIWPYFIPLRDDDGDITPNPAYVFVDRIYPRANLAGLGIP